MMSSSAFHTNISRTKINGVEVSEGGGLCLGWFRPFKIKILVESNPQAGGMFLQQAAFEQFEAPGDWPRSVMCALFRADGSVI